MNQTTIIGIIISLLLGVSVFVASNNYIIGIAILLLGILYFALIARPMKGKYDLKMKRFRECYHFVNTFIVSLSIKSTVQGAYETSFESMPEDFALTVENIDAFSMKEKLEHLGKFFRFHVYSLFLDLINIYEEQGGDIIDMSRYLLDEVRMTEEYIISSHSASRKKVTEFAILWVLTMLIMVILRFSLSQFFTKMASHIFYPIGVGVIGLFCIASIHIAMSKMCFLKIKGWNDAEKI